MSQRQRSHVIREGAKLGIRTALLKANLGLEKDPYVARLARSLRHARIDTVLDVGANVGQFGALIRSAGFDRRIISCEPLSEAYASLAKRSADDASWTAVNSAVGAEIGTASINVSENSYSSSLLGVTDDHLRAAPRSRIVATEEVPVTTVADLVTTYGLDPQRTLLKIDTQGFEGPVLDGAGDLLDSIAMVQLELSLVELYAGQATAGVMTRRLTGHGLTLWGVESGIADENGRILQVDALFAREP